MQRECKQAERETALCFPSEAYLLQRYICADIAAMLINNHFTALNETEGQT